MEYLLIGLNKIKEFVKQHPYIVIFFIALFFYTTSGLYLFYYNDLIINHRWDLIYGFDTRNRYLYLYFNQTPINTSGHPLNTVLQSFIGLVNFLGKNPKITMILSQSLIASCSCCLFFY